MNFETGNTTFIYVLIDSDGKVRYVGRTIRPKARFGKHRRQRPWVTSAIIIEAVSAGEHWQERERFWIGYYQQWFQLENKTSGGDSLPEVTPAIRQKIREGLLGKPKSEEHKRKLSLARKGRKATAEEVEKNRLSHLGLHPTTETRLKLSAAQRGSKKGPATAERKAKTSLTLKGRSKPLEWRRKIGASHVGMKRTPETCAKLSAARRASLQRRGIVARTTEPYDYHKNARRRDNSKKQRDRRRQKRELSTNS